MGCCQSRDRVRNASLPPSHHRQPAHHPCQRHWFCHRLSARALDPLIPSTAPNLAVDAASVALLSTAFALPFAFVQPILGPLADMVGKIRLMVTCLAVIIIVSCVSALAQSFAVLMLARIVCGMATGGIFPVGLAIIADAVPVA